VSKVIVAMENPNIATRLGNYCENSRYILWFYES